MVVRGFFSLRGRDALATAGGTPALHKAERYLVRRPWLLAVTVAFLEAGGWTPNDQRHSCAFLFRARTLALAAAHPDSGVVEAFALDRVANGVWVDAQFTGNGADFPVLDVKIAANLRAGFRTDHEMLTFGSGMRGNGSMKRPARPQTRQRSHNAGCLSCQDCDPGGCSTASALPQSNDAGETIETEP